MLRCSSFHSKMLNSILYRCTCTADYPFRFVSSLYVIVFTKSFFILFPCFISNQCPRIRLYLLVDYTEECPCNTINHSSKEKENWPSRAQSYQNPERVDLFYFVALLLTVFLAAESKMSFERFHNEHDDGTQVEIKESKVRLCCKFYKRKIIIVSIIAALLIITGSVLIWYFTNLDQIPQFEGRFLL